jgi:hypothetical protein
MPPKKKAIWMRTHAHNPPFFRLRASGGGRKPRETGVTDSLLQCVRSLRSPHPSVLHRADPTRARVRRSRGSRDRIRPREPVPPEVQRSATSRRRIPPRVGRRAEAGSRGRNGAARGCATASAAPRRARSSSRVRAPRATTRRTDAARRTAGSSRRSPVRGQEQRGTGAGYTGAVDGPTHPDP